jgi:hypothetical protein
MNCCIWSDLHYTAKFYLYYYYYGKVIKYVLLRTAQKTTGREINQQVFNVFPILFSSMIMARNKCCIYLSEYRMTPPKR